MDQQRRIVLSLAASQALAQTVTVLLATVGALAGRSLAPRPSLATLPLALVVLGSAALTIPASLLMARRGRRPGFVLGALFGATGGAIGTLGLVRGSFPLLCAGMLCMGGYSAFAQFYRFAAADAASPEFRSRAISLVLAGGVVAAVVGPHLGAFTSDMIASARFAGSFATVVALCVAASLLLLVAPLPGRPVAGAANEPARPLGEIARQPAFVAAIVAGVSGFLVMVTVMTATPLSMLAHDHGVAQTAVVIQWHVLGMYVPSFFTGWLVARLGLVRIMLAGVLVLATQVAVVTSGVRLPHYVAGLLLLGVGWNFLFVGASTLLTETYRPSERGAVQGLNDFLVVAVSAAGSLSAGALVEAVGWRGLNLAVLPFLAAAGAAIVVVDRRRRAATVGAAPVERAR